MLKRGDEAPDFALPDQDGRQRRLTRLLESGPLIVYFYPADFTPGCTQEACDFRDLHARILGSGLRVVGVSPQSPESHRRFRDFGGLAQRTYHQPSRPLLVEIGAGPEPGLERGTAFVALEIENDHIVTASGIGRR